MLFDLIHVESPLSESCPTRLSPTRCQEACVCCSAPYNVLIGYRYSARVCPAIDEFHLEIERKAAALGRFQRHKALSCASTPRRECFHKVIIEIERGFDYTG